MWWLLWRQILVYVLAFAGIWMGSGLAIKSVERLARFLDISTFMVSFVALGLFTSIGELSVGINALIENNPEIYVGSLIGASIVLFLLVTPLLAIVGNSVRINENFRGFNLVASLLVVALPAILVMDGKISKADGVIAVVAFVWLLRKLKSKKSLLEKIKSLGVKNSVRVGKEVFNTLLGMGIVFVASKFVVDQTVYFSDLLGISSFLISLLVVSIGTNVPELSLVIRSVTMRNYQVALGNYVGSAAFNTLLLGVLTLIHGQDIYLTNSYVVGLVFLIAGLVMFYFFARTKNTLSRLEGLMLLVFYVFFVMMEISIHRGW